MYVVSFGMWLAMFFKSVSLKLIALHICNIRISPNYELKSLHFIVFTNHMACLMWKSYRAARSWIKISWSELFKLFNILSCCFKVSFVSFFSCNPVKCLAIFWKQERNSEHYYDLKHLIRVYLQTKCWNMDPFLRAC